MRSPRAHGVAAALIALVGCGSRTELSASVGPGAGGADGSTIDGPAPFDAVPGCGAGGPLEVSYLLDSSGMLYRYDALTNQHVALGIPSCANENVQWTMTASRETAYIVYTDWTLFAVDLATLTCTATAFEGSGLGDEFGVAVSGAGGTEKLYVYAEPDGVTPTLYVADLDTFALTEVGAITPAPSTPSFPVNLTADTLGHLYAFSPLGLVLEIDAATGDVVLAAKSPITSTGTWASLTYGSDLFLFVNARVEGYDLLTNTLTSERDSGISPVGGNSVARCPGL